VASLQRGAISIMRHRAQHVDTVIVTSRGGHPSSLYPLDHGGKCGVKFYRMFRSKHNMDIAVLLIQ
jgi:hypothetical protein